MGVAQADACFADRRQEQLPTAAEAKTDTPREYQKARLPGNEESKTTSKLSRQRGPRVLTAPLVSILLPGPPLRGKAGLAAGGDVGKGPRAGRRTRGLCVPQPTPVKSLSLGALGQSLWEPANMGPCGAKRQLGRYHPGAWGVGRTVSNQMLCTPPTLGPCPQWY